MPYWQLFYHFVWGTKKREPLVTADVEPVVNDFLRGKAVGLGATVMALNGLPDHCHLVAAVPPSIALSEFIGQVKGVASAKFNQARLRDLPLHWQEEYGVFSFHHKVLPNFVAYVEQQKQHHADGRLLNVLERTDDRGIRLIREPASTYTAGDDEWWREMVQLDLATNDVS
jgi:putative transposase